MTLGLAAAPVFTSEAQAGPDIHIGIHAGGFHSSYSSHHGHSHGHFYSGYRVYSPPVYYPVLPAARHYHVMFRTCAFEPWRTYGSYRSHSLAHEVVDHLELHGFHARVVHH